MTRYRSLPPSRGRADYHFDLVDGVVVIYERADRAPLDIQAALWRIHAALGGLGSRPVICRDRYRVFAGIEHRAGRAYSNYPIGEHVLEAALAVAKRRHARARADSR